MLGTPLICYSKNIGLLFVLGTYNNNITFFSPESLRVTQTFGRRTTAITI